MWSPFVLIDELHQEVDQRLGLHRIDRDNRLRIRPQKDEGRPTVARVAEVHIWSLTLLDADWDEVGVEQQLNIVGRQGGFVQALTDATPEGGEQQGDGFAIPSRIGKGRLAELAPADEVGTIGSHREAKR